MAQTSVTRQKLPSVDVLEPNFGIDARGRKEVSEALSQLLASTYALFQKTLHYHWNVTGEQFISLHLLFEQQYEALQKGGDRIAERIRALGHMAPGTLSEFMALSVVPEDAEPPAAAKGMMVNLLRGHESCSLKAREILRRAEQAGDYVTVDLMTTRMRIHEKTAWMLRAHLQT